MEKEKFISYQTKILVLNLLEIELKRVSKFNDIYFIRAQERVKSAIKNFKEVAEK